MSLYRINPLDYNVKIVAVERDKKDKLLSLILRCYQSEKDIFYNVNEGDDELSLIIDTKMEKYYKNIDCTVYPDIYKIIQIHNNSSGIDNVGTVTQISSLFTDINIPIMYINTYNYNYILVKNKKFDKAVNALNELFDNEKN